MSTHKYVTAADGVRAALTRRKFAFDGQAYREVNTEVIDEPCPDCKIDECLGPQALPPEPPLPSG